MTIQNWVLKPDSAMIICDTLATGGAENSPSSFMEKAWIIPHRSIMIAALDWPYPAQTLYFHLAMGYAPTGPDDLIQYATDQFRASAGSLPDSHTNYPGAAVGMFMWDADRNSIDGWMFRTECDFVGEKMPDGGMCILTPPTSDVANKDFSAIAMEQQRQDRLRPARHRDNLGGSLIGYEMKIDTAGRPPLITITNYGFMPHYEEQAAQVADFQRLQGAVGSAYVRT